MQWIRYRFKTWARGDIRPLVFNPSYPWWCSGSAADDSYAIIVAYLPAGEPLERYWDDAEVDFQDDCDEITFTDRFPKPEYFVALDSAS
jgi:hypothetical protein